MLVASTVVISSSITALRLITYSRKGSRYRPCISVIAYALIFCSGAQAIDVVFNHAQSSVWQAGLSFFLMILALHSKGNVSCILDGSRNA